MYGELKWILVFPVVDSCPSACIEELGFHWKNLHEIWYFIIFRKCVEKISWTDHVKNEEVLLRVNEQRNILHEIRKRKANWVGHILRRNCLLQQVTEGKIKGQIEVTRRQGRRRKKLLDDLKDRRRYCQLKEEALDRTMWRNRFARGFGPVVWQITDDYIYIYIYIYRERERERERESRMRNKFIVKRDWTFVGSIHSLLYFDPCLLPWKGREIEVRHIKTLSTDRFTRS